MGGYRDSGSVEESRESGATNNSNREGDRDLEGRYGALYEQRMNPFAEVSESVLCHVMSCLTVDKHCVVEIWSVVDI